MQFFFTSSWPALLCNIKKSSNNYWQLWANKITSFFIFFCWILLFIHSITPVFKLLLSKNITIKNLNLCLLFTVPSQNSSKYLIITFFDKSKLKVSFTREQYYEWVNKFNKKRIKTLLSHYQKFRWRLLFTVCRYLPRILGVIFSMHSI